MRTALLAGLLTLLQGCVTITNAGVLASSNLPAEPADYETVAMTSGEASGTLLFGIPLTTPDQMRTACQRAMERVQVDALVDISVQSETDVYFGIVSVTSTQLHGMGVRFKDRAR